MSKSLKLRRLPPVEKSLLEMRIHMIRQADRRRVKWAAAHKHDDEIDELIYKQCRALEDRISSLK